MDAVFIEALVQNQVILISTMLFVAPGVMIGGYTGPLVAQKLERVHLEMCSGVLLMLVGH